MANIQHQTRSPDSCECVIEEQVDYDQNPPVISLWFFHNVCSRHEPLVKNKTKLSLADWKKQIQDIVKHHENLLAENRARHLKEFDEHPLNKNKRQVIKDMMMSLVSEKYALMLENKIEEERIKTERFLDVHEAESMSHLITGLHSTYALISQEVYDAINQEQAAANPIIENDG